MPPLNWDDYKSRVEVNGSTARDRAITKIHDTISRHGGKSISYKNVQIDNMSGNLFITNTNNEYVKKFQDVNNIIEKVGVVVEYADHNWIVEQMDVDGEVYKSGKLRMCNYSLNFLGSNRLPISRPCYVENTAFGIDESGISISKVNIETGASRYRVILPCDNETLLFDRVYPDTNKYQRIMLKITSARAYEIIDVDTMTGCVILTVEECERSTDDNEELLIGAYYSRVGISPSPRCKIIYAGDPVIELGKAPKKFVAKFYDTNGYIIDTTPSWSLSMANPNLLSNIDITYDGKEIYLKALSKIMIGESIELTASAGELSGSIMLEVVSIGR